MWSSLFEILLKPRTHIALHQAEPVPDEIVYALHQMSLGEYRPLPVVDDQRRPIALVSMQDIIGYLLAFFPQEGFNFPPSPAHRIAPARDGA